MKINCEKCESEIEKFSKFCTDCGAPVFNTSSLSDIDEETAKINAIKRGFKSIHHNSLSDKQITELSMSELKKYFKAGVKSITHKKYLATTLRSTALTDRIKVIEIGYNDVNNSSLTLEYLLELPVKELKRYYDIGIKVIGANY